MSICIVLVLNFFLAMKLIFRVKGRSLVRFRRYIIVLAAYAIVNASLVTILTEYFRLYYMLSMIIVSASLFMLKYVAYSKKVFGNMP
jgi:putative flippase GtrA